MSGIYRTGDAIGYRDSTIKGGFGVMSGFAIVLWVGLIFYAASRRRFWPACIVAPAVIAIGLVVFGVARGMLAGAALNWRMLPVAILIPFLDGLVVCTLGFGVGAFVRRRQARAHR